MNFRKQEDGPAELLRQRAARTLRPEEARVPGACCGSSRANTAKGSVQTAARRGTSACLAAAARRDTSANARAHTRSVEGQGLHAAQ
eukprot:5620750-Lingulodinium_polyedra.AAC.1